MTLIRTRCVGLLAVLFAVTLTASCNDKDVAVTAILTLQTAAITANQTINPTTQQPLLSTADAIAVVSYTGQALATIEATSSGWQTAVQTGWAAAQTHFSAAVKAQFATQIAVLSAAIAAL